MSPRIRIILLASVLFNILLIGMVAGQRLHAFTPAPHHDRDQHSQALQSAVSPEHQQLIADAMERSHETHRKLRPQIHEARIEMEQLMTAETFDKDVFAEQLEALDALHAQGFRGMGNMLLEVLPQLNQQERIALAEALKAQRPHGPPRHGGPPHDGPPHDRHPHDGPPPE